MLRAITPFIALLLLSACSSNYTWDTNLNSKKVVEYFKPAQVKLVSGVSEDAQLVGSLSAVHCDIKPPTNDAIFVELRTRLRYEAASVGANQLIIEQCDTKKADKINSCPFKSRCIAQAYFYGGN